MTTLLLAIIASVVLQHALISRFGAQNSPVTPEKTALRALFCAASIFSGSALSYVGYDKLLLPIKASYLRFPAVVLICAAATYLFSSLSAAAAGNKGVCFADIGAGSFFTAFCASVVACGSDNGFVICAVGAVGYIGVAALFESLKLKLVFADTPDCFKGLPLTFVTAGLIALALSAFAGIDISRITALFAR
ncbi:MAG: hypothetical protein PUE85_06640 [Firmicutes bacterium]|nr:hypothetical protein [Bacillota bacterium]